MGIKPQVCLPVPEGGHRGGVAEKPRLMLRRSAGVGLSLLQMTQDFPNHLLLGDEGDDAVGVPTVALERIGLMNALDELGPSFSERGTLFGGQLRLRVGFRKGETRFLEGCCWRLFAGAPSVLIRENRGLHLPRKVTF